MKRIFSLTIILAAMLPTLLQAAMPPYSLATKYQECEQQGRKKEFMNQRNSFFILELELTREEADAFLPLYNELDTKRYDLWKDVRQKRALMERKPELTDSDMELIINKSLDNKIAEARLEKEYYYKFKRVLPMRKVMALRAAERKFARLFLQSSYE
ncbi:MULTISPECIES: hypothetical protein [Porphyromonas]|uniref:hypothetical protein n=1 Tax=Porphyromonas TaxID=836 RepID=UPI00035FE87A|nr:MULTISPECIES: hypothetical protein [Porphyromonas]